MNTDARKRGWETRRQKYGSTGHARNAYGHGGDHVVSMQALLIRLHEEGVLSEGQVSKATGLHRITVRKMADDYRNSIPETREQVRARTLLNGGSDG
jgi:hypothetical protein